MNVPPKVAPKKSRLGCVASFWLIVGVACLAMLGFQALVAPWGFYLGGKFHWWPAWSGMGTAHAANGRDYLFFLTISPDTRHPGRYKSALKGTAFVCTPKGEKIYLTASAYMDKHLDRNTLGEAIEIQMHRAQTFSNMISTDTRPSVQFSGVWGPDEIPVDDKNSLGRAFGPDGSVYAGHSPTRGPSFPPVKFTFRAATSREFEKACSSQM